MCKIKWGSFNDRRIENGGQCGRTYPSHIFRECPPGYEFASISIRELFTGVTPILLLTWEQAG